MNDKTRGVQSLEYGTKILNVFIAHPRALMLREIADYAEMSPTQIHAYLVSFKKLGLVEQDARSKKYIIGPKAVALAVGRMQTFEPINAANKAAQNLRDITKQTILLAVWGSFGPTIIAVQNGEDQLNIDTREGSVYATSGTATGLVFSTFMPQKTIKAAIINEIAEYGKNLRVGKSRSYASISQELRDIKHNGYATISPSPIPNIFAASAPIFNHSGNLQMALTVTGIDMGEGASSQGEHIVQLCQSANELSRELGYSK